MRLSGNPDCKACNGDVTLLASAQPGYSSVCPSCLAIALNELVRPQREADWEAGFRAASQVAASKVAYAIAGELHPVMPSNPFRPEQ